MRPLQHLFYLFVFLLPWQTRWLYRPARLNGGYWEYGSFSIYGTEILLGLIMALSIINVAGLIVAARKNRTFKPNFKSLKLVLLAGLCVLPPLIFALDPALAGYKLTQGILGLALIAVILLIKPDIKKTAYCIISAGAVQAGLAAIQFFQQKVAASTLLGMAAQDPNVLGTPVVEIAGDRILRAFGALPHPNILGGFLAICLIILAGLILSEKSKKIQALLSLPLILIFTGLLMTVSRAAMIAWFAGLAAYSFILNKQPAPIKQSLNRIILLTVIIFAVFSLAQPEIMRTRIFGGQRLEIQSNQERLAGYSQAWQIFQHHWLTGAGPGNYTLALYQLEPAQAPWYYQPLHNAIFLVIIELGIWFLALLAIGLYWLIISIKKQALSIPDNPLAQGYVIAIFGLLILSCFDHYLSSLYFGQMLGCLIAGLALLALLKK